MESMLIIISSISVIISLISICVAIKTYRQYDKNMKKLGKGKDFAKMMSDYVSQVDNLNKRDDKIIELCNSINRELLHCIKKVGFYKYNAFGNTKNELSFSIALLDMENNGIILNSIYGQDNSNVYAKDIKNGKSKLKLSEEEEKALNMAMNENRE